MTLHFLGEKIFCCGGQETFQKSLETTSAGLRRCNRTSYAGLLCSYRTTNILSNSNRGPCYHVCYNISIDFCISLLSLGPFILPPPVGDSFKRWLHIYMKRSLKHMKMSKSGIYELICKGMFHFVLMN